MLIFGSQKKRQSFCVQILNLLLDYIQYDKVENNIIEDGLFVEFLTLINQFEKL
jgi:hypothetical protein